MKKNHIKTIFGTIIITALFASGITFLQVIATMIMCLTTLFASLLVFGVVKSEDFKRLLIIQGANDKEDFIRKSHYGKSPYPWIWNIVVNLPMFLALFTVFPTMGIFLLTIKLFNDYNFIKAICNDEFIDSLPTGEYDKKMRNENILEVRDTMMVKYKDNPRLIDFLKQIK